MSDKERAKRLMAIQPHEIAEILDKYNSHDGIKSELNVILDQLALGIALIYEPRFRSKKKGDQLNNVKEFIETAFALGRKSVQVER